VNTVNNNTVNNILPPAAPVLPAGGVAPATDLCVNLPGSQLSVPAGHVLTFALNGALVCVTPAIAQILHPTAIAYKVASSSKLVFTKQGRLLCIGRSVSSKTVVLTATTGYGKVLTLIGKGRLVCLRP
jgi:hypothetical protein